MHLNIDLISEHIFRLNVHFTWTYFAWIYILPEIIFTWTCTLPKHIYYLNMVIDIFAGDIFQNLSSYSKNLFKLSNWSQHKSDKTNLPTWCSRHTERLTQLKVQKPSSKSIWLSYVIKNFKTIKDKLLKCCHAARARQNCWIKFCLSSVSVSIAKLSSLLKSNQELKT